MEHARTSRRQMILSALLLCSWLTLGAVLAVRDHPRPPAVPTPEHTTTAPDTTNRIPVRLQIAALGMDVPIVPVGLTESDAMAVPDDAGTVGWFAPGTLPGQTGSTVLSGHLDTVLGTRGAFWNLHKMKEGDSVRVVTQSGAPMLFTVRSRQIYPYNLAPMQEIFAGGSGRYLNLITCNGTWARSTYDMRLVVFTEFDRYDK